MSRRRRRAIVAGLALLTACSSARSNGVAHSNGTVPSKTTTTTATPMLRTTSTLPAPAGLPAFYGVPDPLPPGRPGALVRAERVASPDLRGTLWRVMYHSRSLLDADIVVTGLIAVPGLPPPANGYPVISWAHGTTGIADSCAPSLDTSAFVTFAEPLLAAGYLLAATDYEGLGTPGRHPYIVGDSEARGVLDIVRAARSLPDAHAGDRYLVWGHSQGGHAAMYALHIADQWAPELHLVGVVAEAPPSQLLFIYGALRTSPFKYYLLMAAAGFNAAYGDQAAPLDAVLTPAGQQDVRLVDSLCGDGLAHATAGADLASLVKADPMSVPAWAKLLSQNDPGMFTAPSPEPLLIIHGDSDEQIPAVSSLLLFNQLCKLGQTEQRWIYPGQNHDAVIAASMNDMLAWTSHRFAGQPAPDPVQPTGMPGVQAQRCPA